MREPEFKKNGKAVKASGGALGSPARGGKGSKTSAASSAAETAERKEGAAFGAAKGAGRKEDVPATPKANGQGGKSRMASKSGDYAASESHEEIPEVLARELEKQDAKYKKLIKKMAKKSKKRDRKHKDRIGRQEGAIKDLREYIATGRKEDREYIATGRKEDREYIATGRKEDREHIAEGRKEDRDYLNQRLTEVAQLNLKKLKLWVAGGVISAGLLAMFPDKVSSFFATLKALFSTP